MAKFWESQRRLAALAEIASDGTITQRALAKRLDISLGLANGLLWDLQKRGFVKTNPVVSDRTPRYAVTRAGRGAMIKMSRAFAAEAEALLRKAVGRKARTARLLSARLPAEAKRGR